MKTRDAVVSNITALMASTGVRTQAALSKKSGVAQSHISRILRGESDPTTEMLDAISVAFGVTSENLIKKSPLTPPTPEVADLLATITRASTAGSMTPEQAQAFTALIKATTEK